MKMRTEELSGKALDWAVTMVELERQEREGERIKGWVARYIRQGLKADPYSTDWTWGGPVIDHQDIELANGVGTQSEMQAAILTPNPNERHLWFKRYGPTKLVAAMRCYVASVKGDEIEVPDNIKD